MSSFTINICKSLVWWSVYTVLMYITVFHVYFCKWTRGGCSYQGLVEFLRHHPFSFSLWCRNSRCKIHTFRLYIKLYIMACLNFSQAFFKCCDRGDYGRSTCHHRGNKLHVCGQRSSLRPRFFSRHQKWVSY